MISHNNWLIYGALLIISTAFAVALYRTGSKSSGEIYAQIACGFGGAAMGIFGAIMLVDVYHLEGLGRYFTILGVATFFGLGLQKALLGTNRRGPIDFL